MVLILCLSFHAINLVTEWSHEIKDSKHSKVVKSNWLLGNSSHVLDLAFYLGGRPREISINRSGSLEWHKSGSIFTGSGTTDMGALFTYHANWESAGRWLIEIMTKNHKLRICPLEKLFLLKKKTIVYEEVELNDLDDSNYKPGLFKQVNAFLNNKNVSSLCKIDEHLNNARIYQQIEGNE